MTAERRLRSPRRREVLKLGGAAFLTAGAAGTAQGARGERCPAEDGLVFAEYNVEGLTTERAFGGDDERLQAAAEVVQRAPEPDVLTICEIDNNFQSGERSHTHTGEAFLRNYLNVPQGDGLEGVDYDYFYAPESNTGVPSGIDAFKDGHALEPGDDAYGEDAWGFGQYPGQYALGIYSKYPIDVESVRTMRRLRWRDVPGNRIPTTDVIESELDADEEPMGWLTEAETRRFRVSSKTHADVPIRIGDETVHAVIAHPTPPAFDGPENFNGRRNHGENKLLGDYVRGADYVYDDDGCVGGLEPDEAFVVMGDLNAEPGQGNNFDAVGEHVIDNPRINAEGTPTSPGGRAAGDERWTAAWERRADYVLPSEEFDVLDSAVYWPDPDAEPDLHATATAASDHFMVWSEVALR